MCMKTKIFLFLFGALLSSEIFSQTECVWSGSSGSDWFDETNWSNNIVPGELDQAVITDTTNQPVLSDYAIVGNIIINADASLNLNGNTLEVKGNWTNHGSLIHAEGLVLFNGTNNQTISGNQGFYILEIDNADSVKIISGSTFIEEELIITNGVFLTNDSLTLVSNQNGTASVAPITTGTLLGDVVVQRYVSDSVAGWRFLSSAVSNASLAQLNDDCWTAGYSGSTYPSSSFVSVYYYDETDSGTADVGYVMPGSSADVLSPGKGFMVYIDSTSLISTIDFKGELNVGEIDVPVTYTLTDTISDGWNLVGNPYASTINWDDTSITKTNLYNAIYVWNPETGVYTSYVDGIGANGGSRYIASGQSFYVVTSDTMPELIFTEYSKSSQDATFFKTHDGDDNFFSVSISNEYGSDQTILKANALATDYFDGSFDAIEMWSSYWYMPSIYTLDSNGVYYSINQFLPGEKTVPLYVYSAISGIHHFEFEGASSFQNASCVLLEDVYSGEIYTLNDSLSLDVFVNDTATTARFLLHIGAEYFVQAVPASCYGENDGVIQVAKNSNSLFDLSCIDYSSSLIESQNDIYQIFEINNLYAGTYITQSEDAMCGTLIDTITIIQPEQIVAFFIAENDTLFLPGDESFQTFTNFSMNADYFIWEYPDLTTSEELNGSFDFADAGTYSVKLYAHQSPSCFKTFEEEITVISSLELNENNMFQATVTVENGNIVVRSDRQYNVVVQTIGGQIIYNQQVNDSEHMIDIETADQVVLISLYSQNDSKIYKMFIR